MKIAKEIGDRVGEGNAYGNLGIAYDSLGDCQKTIQYHEKHFKIAKEIGDRVGEGNAHGNLSNAYWSLGDYLKALIIMKNILKLLKKSVIGPEKEEPMETSVFLMGDWVTIKRPLSIMKNI